VQWTKRMLGIIQNRRIFRGAFEIYVLLEVPRKYN
jgi:hypothetical protein